VQGLIGFCKLDTDGLPTKRSIIEAVEKSNFGRGVALHLGYAGLDFKTFQKNRFLTPFKPPQSAPDHTLIRPMMAPASTVSTLRTPIDANSLLLGAICRIAN
jgi:hypothetical protein